MSTITDRLDEWAALAEKATPGPWATYAAYGSRGVEVADTEDMVFIEDSGVTYAVHEPDAAFIAASRTAVPMLAEALRAVLAWFNDRGNHDEDCGWTTFGDIAEDCDCPLRDLYRAIAVALGVSD